MIERREVLGNGWVAVYVAEPQGKKFDSYYPWSGQFLLWRWDRTELPR